jgi:hypothetical protein
MSENRGSLLMHHVRQRAASLLNQAFGQSTGCARETRSSPSIGQGSARDLGDFGMKDPVFG